MTDATDPTDAPSDPPAAPDPTALRRSHRSLGIGRGPKADPERDRIAGEMWSAGVKTDAIMAAIRVKSPSGLRKIIKRLGLPLRSHAWLQERQGSVRIKGKGTGSARARGKAVGQRRSIDPLTAAVATGVSETEIAAYVSRFGVTRIEPDTPDVDTVMNEVRRSGPVVLPVGGGFGRFKIDRAEVDRVGLLAWANKGRVRRGLPPWSAVRWTRAVEPSRGYTAVHREKRKRMEKLAKASGRTE